MVVDIFFAVTDSETVRSKSSDIGLEPFRMLKHVNPVHVYFVLNLQVAPLTKWREIPPRTI
jgi:hypothetical protein